jgi:hypothetical protein
VHALDEAADDERHGAAGVRPDHLHVRVAPRGAAEHHLGNPARRVGAVLDVGVAQAGHDAHAAGMARRVGVEHGAAAVELLEHWRKHRVAQELVAVVGAEIDAVGLERIERVFDLLERAVDVGERQIGEVAETAGMVGGELGGKLVGEPRELARLRVVFGLEVRHRDRGHRERHAALVHVLELARDGRALVEPGAGAVDLIARRHEVAMYVDAGRLALRQRRRGRHQGAGGDRREARQHVAPRQAALAGATEFPGLAEWKHEVLQPAQGGSMPFSLNSAATSGDVSICISALAASEAADVLVSAAA